MKFGDYKMPFMDLTIAQILMVSGLAYLLGSIPFGMVIAKLMGLGNLRDIGSGNIGATNVLRTGNKTAAVLTLIAAPVLYYIFFRRGELKRLQPETAGTVPA